ncbi:nuclear transport factor 2 family protein [Nocardioides luteus]|nr:nuclear transport factor 2 family protein [Nocardioides luteus]
MIDVDVAEVMALERELQTAAARTDPRRLTELLAPDFEEIGASGRLWDLASILEMLAGEDDGTPDIEVRELTGRMIADDMVLLRWQSVRGERRARRTSLWQRRPEGWRLVHHQGTPIA